MEFLIFIAILLILAVWDHFAPSTKDTPSDYVKLKPKSKPKPSTPEFWEYEDILVEPTELTKPLASPSKFHQGNQFMSAEAKQLYLNSPEWSKLRHAVFTRDSFTCQICGSQHSLQCHHISYAHLGDEPMEHLTTLCNSCHTSLHNQLGYDRKTVFPVK